MTVLGIGTAAAAPPVAFHRPPGSTPLHLTPGMVVHGTGIDAVDGDVIYVRPEHAPMLVVTLAEADAPENGQYGWYQATARLRGLVMQKPVVLQVLEAKPRQLAQVRLWVGQVDVSYTLLREGWAWLDAHDDTPALYLEAQDSARRAGLGLWARANPENPATFRREHHLGVRRDDD